MSYWSRNPHQSTADAADDLAHSPSGGRLKMWLCGVGLASLPIGYGIRCWSTGHAVLPGKGMELDTYGPTATALAIAYIAIGAFLHFHYFWGLHDRLHGFSPVLKILAVLVFLGAFGRATLLILG